MKIPTSGEMACGALSGGGRPLCLWRDLCPLTPQTRPQDPAVVRASRAEEGHGDAATGAARRGSHRRAPADGIRLGRWGVGRLREGPWAERGGRIRTMLGATDRFLQSLGAEAESQEAHRLRGQRRANRDGVPHGTPAGTRHAGRASARVGISRLTVCHPPKGARAEPCSDLWSSCRADPTRSSSFWELARPNAQAKTSRAAGELDHSLDGLASASGIDHLGRVRPTVGWCRWIPGWGEPIGVGPAGAKTSSNFGAMLEQLEILADPAMVTSKTLCFQRRGRLSLRKTGAGGHERSNGGPPEVFKVGNRCVSRVRVSPLRCVAWATAGMSINIGDSECSPKGGVWPKASRCSTARRPDGAGRGQTCTRCEQATAHLW